MDSDDDRKSDELIKLRDPEMKDQSSDNSKMIKMIILLTILGIVFILLLITVILYPGEKSINAIYRTEANNQNIELIKFFNINDILRMEINGSKVDSSMNYTFKEVGNHNVSFILNTANYKELAKMFYGIKELVSISFTSSFDTIKITNMEQMFSNCSSLTSIDLSSFYTKNVENMKGMFSGCTSLKSLNLSYFNTSKVKDMSSMFSSCSSLESINLSTFNTENVQKMVRMFYGCENLLYLDISSFKSSNIENISMFNNLPENCQIKVSKDFFDKINMNISANWSIV